MKRSELMVAKDKMLRKIAEKLGQFEQPCNYCTFKDEVADLCVEQYGSCLCNPTECWYEVLERVVVDEK